MAAAELEAAPSNALDFFLLSGAPGDTSVFFVEGTGRGVDLSDLVFEFEDANFTKVDEVDPIDTATHIQRPRPVLVDMIVLPVITKENCGDNNETTICDWTQDSGLGVREMDQDGNEISYWCCNEAVAEKGLCDPQEVGKIIFNETLSAGKHFRGRIGKNGRPFYDRINLNPDGAHILAFAFCQINGPAVLHVTGPVHWEGMPAPDHSPHDKEWAMTTSLLVILVPLLVIAGCLWWYIPNVR